MLNIDHVPVSSTVMVVGAGLAGLSNVQGARLAGAGKIIAVDVLDSKLESARFFGATHVINAKAQDPVDVVLALAAGRKADYAFVAVGSSAAISQANRRIRKGGVEVVVGMSTNTDVSFSLNSFDMTYSRTSVGSNMGSTRLGVEVPRLVELYQQGRLKLDELITARYPLA